MQFVIIHRGPNGERVETEVTAPDRASVFKLAEQKGIKSIISVREGPVAKKSGPASPMLLMGVVLGGVLILLTCLCVYFSTQKGQRMPAREDKHAKMIPEVKPNYRMPTERAVRESVVREKTADEEQREQVAMILKKARDNARAQGLPWADAPRKVSQTTSRPPRFNYNCEEHIATLLEIEPGTMLLGEFDFDEDFLEDLKGSFTERIRDDPDDDAYTRQLKKDVQATKDDLHKRFLAGEDICAIIRDTRKELQSLGRARMLIDTEMHELLENPEASAEDFEDFETAANKILESRGINPLQMPKYWTNRIKLLRAKQTGEVYE